MKAEQYVRLGNAAMVVFERQGELLKAAITLGDIAEGTDQEPAVRRLLALYTEAQHLLGGVAQELVRAELEDVAEPAAAGKD